MSARIQLRRGTAAAATAANPVLASGEVGVEIDTGRIKVGNGVTAWNSLAYVDATAVAGLLAHLEDTTDAHDATAVSFVPAGSIAATSVQAAIEELDTEKASTTALTSGRDWTVFPSSVSGVASDPSSHDRRSAPLPDKRKGSIT